MGRDVARTSPGVQTAFVGFALFLLIGATAAMFGPTIPAFRSTFHISATAAGLLLGGHFAGSLLGTMSPSFLPERLRAPRTLTAVATLCFALGCLTIGSAPSWPVPVAGAGIEGVGWGGIVIVFNALFVSGFGSRSPTMLILLNAVYGLGAILGPTGVALLATGGFRLPFLLVTAVALAVLPFGLVLPGNAKVSAPSGHPTPSASVMLRPLAVFIVAFFLYGGLEAGIGAWEPTHLIATGLSVAGAAMVTSVFWASFTLARLVAAPLALIVNPERLVLGCLAVVVFLALATRVDAITPAAYTGCGLFLGPVFPLAVVWSGRTIRASQRVTSFVISGDLLGGAVLPPFLGQLVMSVGIQALPTAFAVLAAGSFSILLAVQLMGRRLIAISTS